MGTNRRFTARLLLASLCYRMVIAIAFLPASQIHAEQLNSEPLALNGSAVHTDLQLDYYYAALFSEANTPEPDELLAHKNLRMELTVLVDEWSKRRFNQYQVSRVFRSTLLESAARRGVRCPLHRLRLRAQ